MASAVFAAGAIALGDYLLGFLAVIGFAGLPNAYRVGTLARRLRARGVHGLGDEEQLVAIHATLLEHPVLSKRPAMLRINLAKQLEERLRRPEEPLSARLPFMVAYGLVLTVPVIGVGVGVGLQLSAFTSEPNWMESEVPVYSCRLDGAPPEAMVAARPRPTAMIYRCEGMSDTLRRSLVDTVERSRHAPFCSRAPWDDPPADPETVARTEAALQVMSAQVELLDFAALGPESLEAEVRAAVDRSRVEHPEIDDELAEAFVQTLTSEDDGVGLIRARLESGPSCEQGAAVPRQVAADRVFVLHMSDGVPPRRILDYLCQSNCEAVGAKRWRLTGD